MKKFLIALILTLIAVFFAVPVSAEDHVHTWEIVPNTEPTLAEIACATCDQHIIIPTDNLLCSHTFFEYVVFDDEYHGDQCVECGYAVLAPHTLSDMGFVENEHLIECTECKLQIYHSATEWVDESGHHITCDCCEKVETTISHTHENMWVYEWNNFFHAWECGDCGYIECETHTGDICNICGYCSHPNLSNSSTQDICSVECPDCYFTYYGEHDYYSEGDWAYCDNCGREETLLVQYGILLERIELEDYYLVDFLVDGNIYQYKSWNSSLEIGTFVRIKVANDQTVSLYRRVDAEIINIFELNDVENLRDYLRSPIRSNYSYDVTLEEITVSSVTPDEEDICVEFVDGGKYYFDSDFVVYNMTTNQMDSVEEGDVIVYFTPSEEGQKDTIIIIG